MKQFLLALIILITSISFVSAQGVIVEDTILMVLTEPEIDDIIVQNGLPSGLLPINYDVEVHRVVYETPDVDEVSTITASGLVMIPVADTSCGLPMLAYLHGTKLLKEEAFYYLNGEWQLGVIAATSGYAMVMPDYIGLGNSPGIHPYQHNRSQATASVDIMRVCRTICEQKNQALNGQLFLMGYSQGGHATLGTHKYIQEELSEEFTVTASAPGAGAYDLSDTQLDMVASFEPYSVPGYLPYLIQSYQHVYGNLYDSLQQIYVPPYDQTLPPLLQGDNYMWDVDAAMPAVPRDIIQPDYADAFFSDTLHPAYLALKDNDVYKWIPVAPVLFNYCRSDEQVNYQNTIVASEWMINAGATDITVIERDTALDHFSCAQPSIFLSKIWFDGMADFCGSQTSVENDFSKKVNLQIYPNPNSLGVLNFSNSESAQVSVTDMLGKNLLPSRKISANGSLDVSALKPGVVIVRVDIGGLTHIKRLVIE